MVKKKKKRKKERKKERKRFDYQYRRLGFIPGLGKYLEKWQCTAVFLPGNSHGQRSLAEYGFSWRLSGKESACNTGAAGSIPGSGGSLGGGLGNLLQYSCLENPMDTGAWWAAVHRVAKIWTEVT